jgi:aminopeptidase N
LLILLLAGCASTEFATADIDTELDLKIVLLDTSDVKMGAWGTTIMGDNHDLLIIPPLTISNHDWAACIAGHELYHAIYGTYHEPGFSGCGGYLGD